MIPDHMRRPFHYICLVVILMISLAVYVFVMSFQAKEINAWFVNGTLVVLVILLALLSFWSEVKAKKWLDKIASNAKMVKKK